MPAQTPSADAWLFPAVDPGEVSICSLPATKLPLTLPQTTKITVDELRPASTVVWTTQPQLTTDSWFAVAEVPSVRSFQFQPPLAKPIAWRQPTEQTVSETTPVNDAGSINQELVALPALSDIDTQEPLLDNTTITATDELLDTPRTKSSYTRLRPPHESIKLEDRLFYVLQPALETLLIERDLHFPFHPFPYQFEGIAFLYPRTSALLADEMGLGKTMQAISAVRLLVHAGDVRSVLLVCPKPLVSNWVREFHLWAPELPVAVIEGDAAKRQWQWNTVDCPVKIANYESLHRDRDAVADGALHFDLMILDESQRIKNRSGATAQTVRAVSRTRSWALTGTPVENSSEDLLGIFEFVAPGLLPRSCAPQQLGQAVSDLILRRTKDAVLSELPPKLYRDADIELTPAQITTYKMAEEEGVLRLGEMGDAATIQHVFELILRLKQICNFDPATGHSAKFERLEADLEEIAASGHKAIVFSQWIDTIDKLRGRLERFGVAEYHGGITRQERERVIDRFRHDPQQHLILMSYGAGSVGLNLQFCRYVFLFDRWWNPAVEDQAINRAHRIGAAGTVTVTRFVSQNTIEERINSILEEKRALFHSILGNTRLDDSHGLNASDIFGLFKLKCPTGPLRYAA